MDPLSITASVAALLGLGQQIFSSAYRYARAVHGAKEDITSFTTEVVKLVTLLKDVEKIASALDKRSDDSVSNLQEALADCKTMLEALTRRLENANPVASNKGIFERITKKLIWPFSASKTKEMIDELERQKSLISMALDFQDIMSSIRVEDTQEMHTVMLLQITESIHKLELKDASTTLDQGTLQRISTWENENVPHEKTMTVPETAASEEEAKILEAFVAIGSHQTYEAMLQLAYPGTTQWIFQEPKFEEWVLGLEKILWLNGPPGIGKTILAAAVVEHLMMKRVETQGTAVAFFMCRFNEDRPEKSLTVLSSFAAQLASQGERAQKRLTEFYHDQDMNTAASLTMTAHDLQDLVLSLSYDFKTVYLIIDGLDEWWHELNGETKLLLDLSQHCRRIRILFTSRNLAVFKEAFESFSSMDIVATRQNDLELYINHEVERLFSAHSSEEKSRIKTSILEHSEGMYVYPVFPIFFLEHNNADVVRHANRDRFLWVKLVLQTAATPNDIDRLLDSKRMPLTETYRENINRILNLDDPEVGRLTIACLIILAEPDLYPMSPAELIAAAADMTGMQDVSSVQVEDLVVSSLGMLSLGDERAVCLSHISVHDYLEEHRSVLIAQLKATTASEVRERAV